MFAAMTGTPRYFNPELRNLRRFTVGLSGLLESSGLELKNQSASIRGI